MTLHSSVRLLIPPHLSEVLLQCCAQLSSPCIHGAHLCPGDCDQLWCIFHSSQVLLYPASLLCFQLVIFLNVPRSMSITRNTFYSDSDFLFVLKVCFPSSHADVRLLSFLIPLTFQVSWLSSQTFFSIPVLSVHFSCSYLPFSLFLSFLSWLSSLSVFENFCYLLNEIQAY